MQPQADTQHKQSAGYDESLLYHVTGCRSRGQGRTWSTLRSGVDAYLESVISLLPWAERRFGVSAKPEHRQGAALRPTAPVLFACLFVCLLVCLFACLFVCLFACLLACLLARSLARSFARLPARLAARMPWLAGWLTGWLVACWLAGWLVGWWVGWCVFPDWLVACLPLFVGNHILQATHLSAGSQERQIMLHLLYE